MDIRHLVCTTHPCPHPIRLNPLHRASFNPLIDRRQRSDASDESRRIIDLIAKILFGVFLCAGLLAFEKFSIQWIAGKFHERSYAGSYFSSVTLCVYLTSFSQSASRTRSSPFGRL